MDATVQFMDFGVRVKGQLIHRAAMTAEQKSALEKVSVARRALVEAMQEGAVEFGEGWWQAQLAGHKCVRIVVSESADTQKGLSRSVSGAGSGSKPTGDYRS